MTFVGMLSNLLLILIESGEKEFPRKLLIGLEESIERKNPDTGEWEEVERIPMNIYYNLEQYL